MFDNFLEKEERKFYKGLIYKVSENLKNKWNRQNFNTGKYRKLKKEKLEQIIVNSQIIIDSSAEKKKEILNKYL